MPRMMLIGFVLLMLLTGCRVSSQPAFSNIDLTLDQVQAHSLYTHLADASDGIVDIDTLTAMSFTRTALSIFRKAEPGSSALSLSITSDPQNKRMGRIAWHFLNERGMPIELEYPLPVRKIAPIHALVWEWQTTVAAHLPPTMVSIPVTITPVIDFAPLELTLDQQQAHSLFEHLNALLDYTAEPSTPITRGAVFLVTGLDYYDEEQQPQSKFHLRVHSDHPDPNRGMSEWDYLDPRGYKKELQLSIAVADAQVLVEAIKDWQQTQFRP